tara:strand:+ start:4035 stop:4646 length:612 start_codon:yes stop_codon:yes gene_type:complete
MLDPRNLLEEGSAPLSALVSLVEASIGPNWKNLLPSSIHGALRETYKTTVSPLAAAKLFFIQDLLTAKRCLEDAWMFEKLANAVNGVIPDFDALQPITTEELVVAVAAIKEVVPKESLQGEVLAYATATLLHDGCWLAPPGLEGAQSIIDSYMENRKAEMPSKATIEQALKGGEVSYDIGLQLEIWKRAKSAVDTYLARGVAA